jgi:hypothetical protein
MPAMNHQWWWQADIFHAAVERAPEARPAFLEQAFGEDAELRSRITRSTRCTGIDVLQWVVRAQEHVDGCDRQTASVGPA